MTSLYNLTGQYLALQNLDMDPEDLADTFEALEGEIEQKAQGITHVMANLDTQALDTEIARLTKMKKTIESRKKSLKDYLRRSMEATGINKIEWDTGAITIGKPGKVVEIVHPEMVPPIYKETVTEIKIAKAPIAKALKAGEDVPGCKLVDGNAPLRIR